MTDTLIPPCDIKEILVFDFNNFHKYNDFVMNSLNKIYTSTNNLELKYHKIQELEEESNTTKSKLRYLEDKIQNLNNLNNLLQQKLLEKEAKFEVAEKNHTLLLNEQIKNQEALHTLTDKTAEIKEFIRKYHIEFNKQSELNIKTETDHLHIKTSLESLEKKSEQGINNHNYLLADFEKFIMNMTEYKEKTNLFINRIISNISTTSGGNNGSKENHVNGSNNSGSGLMNKESNDINNEFISGMKDFQTNDVGIGQVRRIDGLEVSINSINEKLNNINVQKLRIDELEKFQEKCEESLQEINSKVYKN